QDKAPEWRFEVKWDASARSSRGRTACACSTRRGSGPSFRRGVCSSHMPARHLKAAQTHDDAALRHELAALHWDKHGDAEHAQLERRNVEIERAAAQLERDRADFLERKRTASTVTPFSGNETA